MKRGSLTEVKGSSLDFIFQREHHAAHSAWNPRMASTAFFSSRMDMAHDLYKKDLFAHFGCVNAIEFSMDGSLLISGGDDRRVLLWNIEASLTGNQIPKPMKGEHSSNIFCLSFNSQNSKVFSAGNDEQVIVHDLKTGETSNVFMHEEAVYGVCVNPTVDSVFASAGEDGQVLLFDIRAPTSADPLLLARNYDAFYSVQFHPVEPTFVVTANSKEGVALWDVRKPKVPVLRYGMKRSPQSSMCAKFNSSGDQIVALRRRLPPVLFNTHSSSPVCQFDAHHYYNSCTMKSCCFAGSRDQFILSGSDDFNLYMWRVPDQESDVHYVSDAHMVLKGHRSIVNQVRFNPQNFVIASSGVEKIVKLWSPVPIPGSSGSLSASYKAQNMSRKVYTHEEYIGLVMESDQNVSHDYSHGCTEEDPRMMAFFDSLVQREVEGWTTNTDISDDATTSDADTETTTASQDSSLATSQSDGNTDSDSDDYESTEAGGSAGPSVGPPLPIRKRHSWLQRPSSREPSSKRRRKLDLDANRPTAGSDWILRLIAKKRTQIKAAKREKKKRKLLKKSKKFERRSFLKCFTSSKSYLYQPEKNQNSTLPTERPPESLSGISRRRQLVAPYTTIMVFDGNEESDGNDIGTLDDDSPILASSSFSYSSSRPSCSNSSTRHKLDTIIWSSDSSCSSDDEKNYSLKAKVSGSGYSDLASAGAGKYSELRGIVSDIIESEDSDVEEMKRVARRLSRGGNLSNSGLEPSFVFDGSDTIHTNCDATDDLCNTNIVLSESQSPLDINDIDTSCSASDAIPISSISTDETGSVLFELNNGSTRVNSEMELNAIGACLSPCTPKEGEESPDDSSNADTPDSGICMAASAKLQDVTSNEINSEKEKENADPISEQQQQKADDGESSPNDSVDFSLKRQILKSRLKSYRCRVDDEL